MSMENGVWALIECQNGELRDGAVGLVCQGRKISKKLGEELTAAILGNIEDSTAQVLAQYGADQILFIELPALNNYDMDIQACVLEDVIRGYSPSVILAGDYQTDLLSRVAANLSTSLVTFCDGVDVGDDKLLLFTKAVYGGKASATYICPQFRPQIATLTLEAFETGLDKKVNSARGVKITRIKADTIVNEQKIRRIGLTTGDPKNIDLNEADIIVDGGRGMSSEEGFKLIEELAELIGGAAGASRIAVDKGWCSSNRQIGTTGKMVKPRLVLACGVSGAPQHIMGMKDANTIIAINTDRKAPIFNVSDISVVADVKKLLPLLISEIRKICHDNSSQSAMIGN